MSHLYERIKIGDELPPLEVPLTRSLIVATAIASRDYQDVHHDPGLAVERGSQATFTSTRPPNGSVGRFVTRWVARVMVVFVGTFFATNGFVGRFVPDGAGPDAILRNVSIRLGPPNYPG